MPGRAVLEKRHGPGNDDPGSRPSRGGRPPEITLEAAATGAEVLAVACPYEVSRFEDSLKLLGYDDRMVVKDVMELVAEAMED